MLLEINVLPVIIGGTQDLDYGQYLDMKLWKNLSAF